MSKITHFIEYIYSISKKYFLNILSIFSHFIEYFFSIY